MTNLTLREQLATEIYLKTISCNSTLRPGCKPQKGYEADKAVERADELLEALKSIPAADLESKRLEMLKFFDVVADSVEGTLENKILVGAFVNSLRSKFKQLFPA